MDVLRELDRVMSICYSGQATSNCKQVIYYSYLLCIIDF